MHGTYVKKKDDFVYPAFTSKPN